MSASAVDSATVSAGIEAHIGGGIGAAGVHHALLDRLASDPAEWARQERVGVLAAVQRLRGWIDAREAAVLAVAHRERDDVDSGARDLAQLVCEQAGVGFGDGKRREARAMWLPELELAGEALAAGRLGTAQADALCELAQRLEPAARGALADAEAELVAELGALSPTMARKRLLAFEAEVSAEADQLARLERQRRANHLRLPSNADGTIAVRGQLDPIGGAALRAAIDARVDAIWRRETRPPVGAEAPAAVMSNDRRRAQALVELATASALGPDGAPINPDGAPINPDGAGRGTPAVGVTMMVLIDHQTLLGQLAAHPECRLGDATPIPAAEARRLACDATIIPVVLAGRSQVLDIGRAARLATAAQRQALAAIHPTCCVTSCQTPFTHCDIHHLTWWRNHGRTDLDNLAPLCNHHHQLVHSGSWTLTLHPDRTATIQHSPSPAEPAQRGSPPRDAPPSAAASGRRGLRASAKPPALGHRTTPPREFDSTTIPLRC